MGLFNHLLARKSPDLKNYLRTRVSPICQKARCFLSEKTRISHKSQVFPFFHKSWFFSQRKHISENRVFAVLIFQTTGTSDYWAGVRYIEVKLKGM